MDEIESLASIGIDRKKINGGLEVSLLREYVEDLEKRQMKLAEEAQRSKIETELKTKDQADVYYYLNKKLDENYEIIHNLEEQILREQSEREVSEKEYEQNIEQLNAKIAADEAKNKSKIFDLEDRLEAMRDFIEQKSVMQQKLDELTATLNKERAEFSEKYEMLDKARIQEKRQLRNDFDMELEHVKRQHKEEIDNKLSTKAKRSKLLNIKFKKELSYQTLQAEQVLLHDKEVAARDRSMRTEVELSKGMEEEMQKKLVEYQRTIKSLNKKLEEDVSILVLIK